MRVEEIMSSNPVCCTPDTSVREVARLMAENDCGLIPVVTSMSHGRLVGVVTDRDLACRVVAKGLSPIDLNVASAMSGPAVTTMAGADVEDCLRLMEERQIRRVPVVDAEGACVGIVAQADIARHLSNDRAGAVVRDVSRPNQHASNVA
jgi:CBS domain-containing protein